jgi:DNA-binding PadR family transcriptional regulator
MSKRPWLHVRRRRAAVLGVLAEHGPLTTVDICKRIGWWGSVSWVLVDLESEGLVSSNRLDQAEGSVRRHWRLVER